jgi:hypothetical protein
MYFPIAAPRIYAASSSNTTSDRILESEDDTDSHETRGEGGLSADAQSISSELKVEDGQDGISTPATPMTPAIRPVEHDSHRRTFPQFSRQEDAFSRMADKEPLLSLKISRTGHLFAVITSTSLTIWQTKACKPRLHQKTY